MKVDILNARLAYTDENQQEHTWVETMSWVNPDRTVGLRVNRWGKLSVNSDPKKKTTISHGFKTREEAISWLEWYQPAMAANVQILVSNQAAYPARTVEQYRIYHEGRYAAFQTELAALKVDA